jgi:hypothetical protein
MYLFQSSDPQYSHKQLNNFDPCISHLDGSIAFAIEDFWRDFEIPLFVIRYQGSQKLSPLIDEIMHWPGCG